MEPARILKIVTASFTHSILFGAVATIRVAAQSTGDVWILECENATYRVKLVPDMAATIEQIR